MWLSKIQILTRSWIFKKSHTKTATQEVFQPDIHPFQKLKAKQKYGELSCNKIDTNRSERRRNRTESYILHIPWYRITNLLCAQRLVSHMKTFVSLKDSKYSNNTSQIPMTQDKVLAPLFLSHDHYWYTAGNFFRRRIWYQEQNSRFHCILEIIAGFQTSLSWLTGKGNQLVYEKNVTTHILRRCWYAIYERQKNEVHT